MSSNQIKQSQLIQSIVDNLDHGKTRYAFLLGAGASVSSGIPLAKDLAERWFHELKTYNPDAYQPIAAEVSKLIAAEVEKGQIFSRLYSKIYSKRFESFSNDGYSTIEKIITAPSIKPSIGYTLLADILLQTSHNLILTTNFDRLAETELLTIYGHHAKLIYHESLLPILMLGHSFNKPTILKVHNDVYFHPQSAEQKINTLLPSWQNKISYILETYNLIVLGYGGNEKEGLANFLKKRDENTKNRIFWCTIGGNSPPDNNFRHVKIDGFDEFITTLHDKLPADNKTLLDKILKGIARNAQDKIQKINQEIRRKNTRKSNKTIERLTKFAANTWLEYQIKIDHTESIDEKEEWYKEGLEKFSKSAELMGNYAVFLNETRKTYDEAEKYYLKALEHDPDNATILGNYATFLWKYIKGYDKAEKYYLKALEIDPIHATNNGNYATFLRIYIKDYDKTEKHYLLALKHDLDNATILGNYAFFLHEHRGNLDQAEIYYKKALEIEPNNAANNGNYAIFLWKYIKDYDKAKKYYLKALKIDPDNVNNNCNYAVFLQIHHKDYNQAEKYYLKALEIEPNNAHANGNYADLLLATNKKKEAIPYLEIAEKTSNQDSLKLMLLFFRLAHFLEDYEKSKSAISELLQKGVRSDSNFDAHIDCAKKDGITNVDELRKIAKAINTEAPKTK